MQGKNAGGLMLSSLWWHGKSPESIRPAQCIMRGALLLPVGRITFCIYYAFIRAKKNYRERRARRGDIYYPPPAADINITHKRAGDNKMHISN
jgi:hypothetical protein